MNGGLGNFRSERFDLQLDLTEVLTALLDAIGKQPEKQLVQWALLRLSAHQVELAKVLSAAFPELGKSMTAFYEKRVDDHRRALRVVRLLSFRSASSIEEEAARRAQEDTRAMVAEVSLLKDEAIAGLVNDHREVLRRLCEALLELIRERPDARVDLDYDALNRFFRRELP